MHRQVLSGLLALLGASLAQAAPRQVTMVDFVQDIWDAGENGPPHPGVTSVLQSRDGYLWVGTFAGVARFDGVQFRAPEIADPEARAVLADHIRTLAEGPDGALWFGGRRRGVVRLKDGRTTIVRPEDGLPNGEVRAIAFTPDGTVWLGTPGGLAALDTAGKVTRFGTDEGLASTDVGGLHVDADGTLWVGTGRYGVARFDGKRFQSRVLDVPPNTIRGQAFGLPYETVGALVRDADGNLWAGCAAGLIRVPEPGREAPILHAAAVNRLAPAARGGLWASTGAGLGRLENGRWKVHTASDGLVTDDLLAVYEDRESSLWIGTRMGLIRLRPRAVQSYGERDGIGGSGVHCVLEARNGDVWVGHRKGAARLRNGRWTAIASERAVAGAAVRSLAETPDGIIWIGTSEGLTRHENGRATTIRPATGRYDVRALATDRHGTLWVATTGGLHILERGGLREILPRDRMCDPQQVMSLYVDREDTIWVGGSSALSRIRNGTVECLKDKDVPTRNDVRAIYEDAENRLWIASIAGLSWYADGVRHHVVGEAVPFKASVYGVLDDVRGAYWFSTAQGLFRVDKSRLHLASDPVEAQSVYRAFGTADGMDTPVGNGGGVPSAWRGRDGRLYFSTVLGVAIVDPSRIEETRYDAPIVVNALLADRRPVPITSQDRPRLIAGTRDIEVQFAMLSFVAPDRVQYKYKLEGYDRDWVSSGNRRVAYYTNLRPGPYRFRVIAANHRNVWNDTGATLDFELLPRFYERPWFQLAAALGLVLLAFGAYTWRVRQLRAHERELETRVKEAVAQIHTLKGLLPICASCKKIRDDSGYWNQMETYISGHSGVDFSHSICPDCMASLYPEYVNAAKK